MVEVIRTLLDDYAQPVAGFVMATALSVLRVIYDKEETSFVRIVLESLICGGLCVASGSGFQAAGLGPDWYLFLGGWFGFFGAQTIRALAKRYLVRSIDK